MAVPGLSFRDASKADIGVILALCRAGAADPNRYPPLDLADPAYETMFDWIAASPDYRLMVAEAAGNVVGTLMITITPDLVSGFGRGVIENVHVRAGKRGGGIGAAMMGFAIDYCRARGCGLIQLTSNKVRFDAHRFYKKLGFEASHEGFKMKF